MQSGQRRRLEKGYSQKIAMKQFMRLSRAEIVSVGLKINLLNRIESFFNFFRWAKQNKIHFILPIVIIRITWLRKLDSDQV